MYALRFALVFAFALVGVCPAFPAPVLGGYIDPDGTHSIDDLTAFVTQLGVQPSQFVDNYNHHTFFWDNDPNVAPRIQYDIANGYIPMLSWNTGIAPNSCVTFQDILAGRYDSDLANMASTITSFQSTILLRLFYEPNDNPWESCSNPNLDPNLYVQTYQYVVNFFRNAGATNVQWIWCPGEVLWAKGNWASWYPGDSYVDIAGEDLYDRQPNTSAPSRKAFPGEICTQGANLGKPLMIAETGALGAANQRHWLGTVPASCENLVMFLYWDQGPYVMSNPSVFSALAKIGGLTESDWAER